MTTHNDPLYRLIVEIRGAFNDLKALSDAMIADLGVTAAMRAVIEHLTGHGPQTVPQIADAKSVSRQHIQLIADALQDKGLVVYHDNPAHKRSRLVDLTADGRAVFEAIRSREAALLAELSETGQDDWSSAADIVARLRARLRVAD